MKVEARRARPEEYAELIAFGNRIFGIDFGAELPKFYVNHPETAPYHDLVTEDGRIAAMVASFPLTLCVGGEKLPATVIGTVSVDTACRGRDYMKLLMNRAVEAARARGDALMALGGQRQRYGYFGFERVGCHYVYSVTPTNCRHARADTSRIAFEPFSDRYSAAALRLHDAQDVHAVRTADRFLETIRSWRSDAWAVMQDGAFAGYASVTGYGSVQELVLAPGADAAAAVLKLVERYDRELKFAPSCAQPAVMAALDEVAESASVSGNENVNILDYPRVLEACLNLRAGGLPDGMLTAAVEGGGSFTICVEGGGARVRPAQGAADITLPHLAMMRRLFAPVRPLYGGGVRAEAERGWFPAPLFLPYADMG